jgi:Protein of unknown function (DUF3828)
MQTNKIAMKSLFLMLLLVAVSCSSMKTSNAANANINSTPSAIDGGAAQANSETSSNANTTQTAAPETLVSDLYKQHDAKKGPFFQNKNRALVDKYFTKSTADLIWKDATRPEQNEIGALGADPLYDAQDFEIKKFAVGKAEIKDKSATVPVTFESYGKNYKIIYALALENNVWKIADINYPSNDYTLTGLYKENEKVASNDSDESPTGEFEGKYQIGETICTVKPIKMAFEVKWEKGSGTEIFFSQDRANDKYIFASDPPTGKANIFSFDDENYNTGIFYRADGKEFPIKRIK